jgi:hypothetical protein
MTLRTRTFPSYLSDIPHHAYSNSQATRAIGKMLKWGLERIEEGKHIKSFVCSGVANPDVWNPLEDDILRDLSAGMELAYWPGPVVCTDNNGRNSLIYAYSKYPESVQVMLSPTYNLYHWFFIGESVSNGKGKVRGRDFKSCKVLYEGHHYPLAARHSCIQTDSGKCSWLHYELLEEYEIAKPFHSHPASEEEIPAIMKKELAKVLKEIRGMFEASCYLTDYESDGQTFFKITHDKVNETSKLMMNKINFDLLTAEDIRDVLTGKQEDVIKRFSI